MEINVNDNLQNLKRGLPKVVAEAEPSPRVVSFDRPSLELSSTGLTKFQLAPLVSALMTNVVVSHIDLSNNPRMGDAGAELLGDLLRENPTIRGLNLSRTNIGHWGVRCLAGGMCVHRRIEALNFAGNVQTIGDLAAVEVQRMLCSAGSQSLKELVLMDTGISIGGAVTVVEGLMQCPSLIYLSLPSRLGQNLLDEVDYILREHRLLYYRRFAAPNSANSNGNSVDGGIRDRWLAQNPKPSLSLDLASTLTCPSTTGSIWGHQSTRSAALCLSLLSKKESVAGRTRQETQAKRDTLSTFGDSRSARRDPLPALSPRR